MSLREDLSWQDRSACRDEDREIFYPTRGVSTAPAKKVCARCPVTNECLAYALERRDPYGIWGGLTEDERESLQKKNLGRIAS